MQKTSSSKGIIKVAFATNDGKNIDAHFGGAKHFHIYNISSDKSDLFSVINIEEKDTDETIAKLLGIDIVYFTNIGPTAAAKIINKGIFPIKYKDIVTMSAEIDKLKVMLGANPPPFIKKIIEKKGA